LSTRVRQACACEKIKIYVSLPPTMWFNVLTRGAFTIILVVV